jgi:transcription antitermination factor NusA-like protein
MRIKLFARDRQRGQNARLDFALTGWDINIEKDESAAQVFEARVHQAAKLLVDALGN